MDDRRFDSLTRALAKGGSRRTLLKGLLGLGAATASAAVVQDTEAARRGYPGPPLPRKPTARARRRLRSLHLLWLQLLHRWAMRGQSGRLLRL